MSHCEVSKCCLPKVYKRFITSHYYYFYYCSFPCGRWLGRGVDDDSSERLLIGKRISESDKRGHNVTATRIRSPSVPPMRSYIRDSEIQQHLGAYIRVYFYSISSFNF